MIGSLSWIDLAWPMMAAACLTLAFVHFGVWLRQRHRWEHFMLAGAALSITAVAWAELALMHSTTAAEAIRIQRLGHVPVFVNALFLAGLAHFHFGSTRRWLLGGVVVTRSAVLALALVMPNGVNYERIVALHRVLLPGGAEVSVLEGVVSRWNSLAVASWALLIALVADAAYSAWRRSPPASRARIARVGGAVIAFFLLAPLHGLLIHTGVLRIPYFITPIFCLVVFAMATELTADIVRASRLADDLRASEGRLRESEVDRELAVDAAGLALWSLDMKTHEVRAAGRFREIFGLVTESPFRLETVFERIHPDDREAARKEIEAAAASGQPAESEVRVRASHGGWKWVRCTGRVDDSAPGSHARLRGVCYDVTDLRLAEERFRLVVESAPSALLIFDDGGRVTFANQRAVEMFGYTRDELAGLQIEQLVPARLRERHLGHRDDFLEHPWLRPMGTSLELRGLRKSGAEFPADISLAPMPSDGGSLVVALVTDVSARHEQELASARQRAELTHLSRVAVLGELSASLAHEINQPLAAILSNAEAAQRYLERDPVDLGELREIVDDIVADDRRAGEVIRRLRAMLRKEELPRVALDLNEVIRGVLQIVHSDLVNRGVAVESGLAEGLPPVEGDAVQLQQVLLNLIVNACDAMAGRPRPRRLTVRTRCEAADVWTEIGDEGTGIPETELERIFEPFVTTKTLGTGLGLSVCRTIVASHEGRIWARNDASGGATVTVALPANPGSAG